MSTLSPINRDRFYVTWHAYGNATAGAIYTFPAFTKHTLEIVCLTFSLQTDANVTDRRIRLKHNHGAHFNYFATSGAVQTASQLCFYLFARGLTLTTVSNPLDYQCPIPDDILFVKDDLLTIIPDDLEVADQIKNITVRWKVYPTG